MDSEALRTIRADHSRNTREALQETLDLVLRTCPDLTWKNVADALRNIGEETTARTIEDKFCRDP